MRRAEYQSCEAQGHLSRVEALIAQSDELHRAARRANRCRFGCETGLALLKLREIVRSNCGKWGRWWQANEDRFEYSDRSARLYIAGGEAAGQEMATRCRIRPLFLWRIFRGSAGAGVEGILKKLLC